MNNNMLIGITDYNSQTKGLESRHIYLVGQGN